LEELFEKLKKGDEEAFEEIVNIYEQQLLLIAKHRLRDISLANDVVQETFIALFVSAKKIRKYEKLKSWLVKVLINKCNKAMREVYIPNISLESMEIEKVTSENEFKSIIDDIDFLKKIDFLNTEDRTIMIMYFSEEYTMKEISEILNIKIGTLKSKISRIKDKIEEEIRGNQYE
jgi:RNA polymerase sigma-70 factor (ECF subfamily)